MPNPTSPSRHIPSVPYMPTLLYCTNTHVPHRKFLTTTIFTAHNPFVLHNECVDKTARGWGKRWWFQTSQTTFLPILSTKSFSLALPFQLLCKSDRPAQPNKPRGKPLPFLFPLTTTNARPLPRSLSCPTPSPRVYRTHKFRNSHKDCCPLKSFPAGSNPTPFTQ